MSMAREWQNMGVGNGGANGVGSAGAANPVGNALGNDVANGVGNADAANPGGNGVANDVGRAVAADNDFANGVGNDVAIDVGNGVADGVGNYVANPAGNDRQNTDVGVANDVTNPGGNANDVTNPGGNANAANPGGNADAINPVGIADAVNPVGIADAVNPVGIANAANPGGIAGAGNPVGNGDAANPVGIANAANPVGIANAANPVGIANAANPGGIANAANPGGIANAANPGGIANAANPGGIANAANPGGIADAANHGGNANAANPGGIAGAANPVGIAGAANPVGIAGAANPVGIADAANPLGNSDAINPVGNADAAHPVGIDDAANPVGNANAANPVGNATAANPVGIADAANPVGIADAANPVGIADVANPVGNANAANPGGNANAAGNDVANGVENDVSANPGGGDADQGNGRAESDYSRPTKRDPRGMRTGYTTGTTAAAAAKAAVILMLSGKAPAAVSVPLPGGTGRAELAVQRSWAMDPAEGVRCSAIKDGGDDPDVTHGAEIIVGVWRLPDGMQGLQITGGPGVGTVTRPGTGIEVGEPAVTRVPRRMMADAVGEGLVECGWPADTGVRARISVVNGEAIAEQTTNARLGVLGGISILGSTGVVQPFSTAAWRASVHLAIDVAAANGVEHLVLSTGTRSEEYTRRVLALPDMAYIEAGIFSGPAMKRCVNKGIKRVSHVGMVGKFSKMAMGHFVTHVAGNRVDTEFLAGLAGRCGASESLQAEMRDAASGRHFQELAQEHEVMEVFPMMCSMVCDEGRRYLGADGDAIIIDALCYDFEGNLLGSATTTPDGIPLRRDDGAAGV